MPIYVYKCPVCSSSREVSSKIEETHEVPKCDSCTLTMVRDWSSPAVIFNAPGFYSTDKRKK